MSRIEEIQKEISMLIEDEKYWTYCLNDPKEVTTPLVRESLSYIKRKIPYLKAEIAVIKNNDNSNFYEPIPKGDPDGLDADEANFDEDLE